MTRGSKREDLLTAAGEEFRARGYDAASVSAITARFGGSKATLYTHYPSKAVLFDAWLTQALGALPAVSYAALSARSARDPLAALVDFGAGYVRCTLDPDRLDLMRIAIAHADVAPRFAEQARREDQAFDQQVAQFLAARLPAPQRGPEAWRGAASQFRALMASTTLERLLRRPIPPLARAEARGIARRSALAVGLGAGALR